MNHNEEAKAGAEPKKQEPILPSRMIRIGQQDRDVVTEDRFGFLK